MPIEVRSPLDVGAIGQTAFLAGYNRAAAEKLSRDRELEQRALDSQLQFERQAERDRLYQQFKSEEAEKASVRRMIERREEYDGRMAFEEGRITAKEKSELDRLNQAESKVMTDPKYDDAAREQFMMEIDRRRAGITGPSRQRRPQPTEIEQAQQRTWTNDAGELMSMDASGVPKVIGNSLKDQIARQKLLLDTAMKFEEQRNAKGNPIYTIEQAVKRARELLGAVTGQAESGAPVPGQVQPGAPQPEPQPERHVTPRWEDQLPPARRKEVEAKLREFKRQMEAAKTDKLLPNNINKYIIIRRKMREYLESVKQESPGG